MGTRGDIGRPLLGAILGPGMGVGMGLGLGLALSLAAVDASGASAQGAGRAFDSGAPRTPASKPVRFEVSPLPLVPGESPPGRAGRAFALLSADMEGDGDLDLLLNRHNVAPLELWENVDGRFRWLNRPGADVSGLYENPGVPYLYARPSAHLENIASDDRAGLYVWHDPDRVGPWYFHLRADPGLPPLFLTFETNWEIDSVGGLGPDEYRLEGTQRVVVSLAAGQTERDFSIDVRGRTSTRAFLELGQSELPLFVGRERTFVPGGRIELWKPDPHGMTWVDVQGSREPELVVVRGALQGSLAPPEEPKFERFYEFTAGVDLYEMAPTGFLPRSFARSRQVEWVDVDGDGALELYVGSRESPNQLLFRVGGAYVDRATELGLDLFEAESFTWFDVDGDRREDLLFVDSRGLGLLRNVAGGFVAIDAAALGLAVDAGPATELFRRVRLAPLDFDNDGALDLLVSSIGAGRRCRLFARRGAGFEDVTASSGLAAVRDASIVLPFDADNDAFVDLAVAAAGLRLLRNRSGVRFDAETVPEVAVASEFDAATITDTDGDGRQDVVAVRTLGLNVRRVLARNATGGPNSFLRVALEAPEAPVGALVSAHFADGSVRVQRYGSADNPPFCQALAPLHFGVPDAAALSSISVLWPGALEPVHERSAKRAVGGTLRIAR